jgi:hypothetical protein
LGLGSFQLSWRRVLRGTAYLLDNCSVVVGVRPNWVMYGWCYYRFWSISAPQNHLFHHLWPYNTIPDGWSSRVENRNRAALDTFLRFDAEFPLFAACTRHTVRARVFSVLTTVGQAPLTLNKH